MRWAVVVPTIRPEKFKEFLSEWKPLFEKYKVFLVVVEDADSKCDLGLEEFDNFAHFTRKDVPEFIPTKTDMIRSWGFYYVWKQGLADYVVTLDDDVTPVGDVFAEYQAVFEKDSVLSSYLSVGALTDSGLEMRGFPYIDRVRRPVAVQYGGWSGVLDYDAATQLAVPMADKSFMDIVMPVPKGVAATCCIMNAAWRVEYTPVMWQLPMLLGRYNRVGDIWSGLFIKRTLDALQSVMVINGKARVWHRRASDAYSSLEKEAPSVRINDRLWDSLVSPKSDDMIRAYIEVTDSAAALFEEYDPAYAEHFIKARGEWLKLFQDTW